MLYKLLFIILSLTFTVGYSSYDVLEAQAFDDRLCIASYTNRCINAICLTSDERDCQLTCKQGAIAKCKVEEGARVSPFEYWQYP